MGSGIWDIIHKNKCPFEQALQTLVITSVSSNEAQASLLNKQTRPSFRCLRTKSTDVNEDSDQTPSPAGYVSMEDIAPVADPEGVRLTPPPPPPVFKYPMKME